MKIVFCAYRDWAIKVLHHVQRHPRVDQVIWVQSSEEREIVDQLSCPSCLGSANDALIPPDMILFCGWSYPPSERLVKLAEHRYVPMFSEHPATSDRYSLGTPLQNQILDGKTHTKHRLVKVGYPELSPRAWSHEIDMSLSGNMSDILNQMTSTAIALFDRFLDDYPHVSWNIWPELPVSEQVPKRTPDMSALTEAELSGPNKLTTKKLYDKIRCLEEPYPNAFIEDEYGTIYFNRVSYKAK